MLIKYEASALSFEDLKTRFYALDDWFNSPQGIHLGHAFIAELAHLSDFLYGTTLLQLGSCGDNLWLQALHYSHKWLVTPYLNPAKSTLISSFTQLPLDRESVDCVIAPLTLEAFTHQKNPLDEIDRVLKPMGYAVFFGINPMSLWGVKMHLGRLPCFGAYAGKSMSAFFVKRAMVHRGYVLCNLSSFYYIPPLKKEKWLHKLEILNELGKMIWPCPPGFYCLVAQKQQEAHPDVLLETASEDEFLLTNRVPLQPI
ncbi:TPA: methyltransferase domain-containing protein [Legionella feeleii]|uniref:Methyl-transferase n=1 Tax=Legionella feeleii TaxID=453 RepID=A0A378IVD0_9GAMM|nr:methyltransferase domain-containing protein [Legionella feeleii]STX38451.1 methyl-transferase [Legionella feeleii]